MEKIQLHSKWTFVRKYIISIWMLLAALFMLYSTFIENSWCALIIILLLINGIVFTIRKFLFPLKNVYLDKVNKKIMVDYWHEIIEIPIAGIEKLEEQSRLGKIIHVKLNSVTNFGSEFIFVPKNNDIISEIVYLKKN